MGWEFVQLRLLNSFPKSFNGAGRLKSSILASTPCPASPDSGLKLNPSSKWSITENRKQKNIKACCFGPHFPRSWLVFSFFNGCQSLANLPNGPTAVRPLVRGSLRGCQRSGRTLLSEMCGDRERIFLVYLFPSLDRRFVNIYQGLSADGWSSGLRAKILYRSRLHVFWCSEVPIGPFLNHFYTFPSTPHSTFPRLLITGPLFW